MTGIVYRKVEDLLYIIIQLSGYASCAYDLISKDYNVSGIYSTLDDGIKGRTHVLDTLL